MKMLEPTHENIDYTQKFMKIVMEYAHQQITEEEFVKKINKLEKEMKQ